jgi:hypothetical protein
MATAVLHAPPRACNTLTELSPSADVADAVQARQLAHLLVRFLRPRCDLSGRNDMVRSTAQFLITTKRDLTAARTS